MGKRLAALALSLLMGAASAHASPWTGAAGRELNARLDEWFLAYDTMGACVAVFENGQVVYTYCYGSRNAKGDSVSPDSGFQVGSISKMVSNIGLMKLVETGKAALEDDLGALLGLPVRSPYFPEEPITLRQMMTHTAGFRDSVYYDRAAEGEGRPLSELLAPRRVKRLFWPGNRPGEQYRYANFGGGLIGSLIEKLTGQTLDVYMAEAVFAPLGITAAYQAALLPDAMPLCDLYHMPSRRLAKTLDRNEAALLQPDAACDYVLSAGKLILSAPDLCKLLIVLCDGGVYQHTRLLKEGTVAEMRTPQDYRGSVRCNAECGLFLNIVTDDLAAGRTLYGHGGKANGMLCAAYFDPAERTGVVMLTNGCRNTKQNGAVGMLSHLVLTELYAAMDAAGLQASDPYRVE